MKILVVDDELLVRIGIKSCIEWQKHGMEIAGEASDGIEALRQINLCKPDVVLLDIKMPNMDGIELMQKMSEEGHICKVLILSGFEDIYHVKEAMRLGAVDYLHKPYMNPNDILHALLNIKQQIEKEKSLANRMKVPVENREESEYILKEVFLKELVENPHCEEQEFVRKCSELNIRLQNGSFTCLVFSIRSMAAVKGRYKDGNINILQSAILNIMNGILAKENNIEFFSTGKNIYVALVDSMDTISEKKTSENVGMVINMIIDAMKRFLNIDIVIGVSDVHRGFKGLKPAYEQALCALKHRFYLEADIIRFGEIKKYEDREALVLVDTFIEKMKDYLTRYDYHKFVNTLENLINFLKITPCLQEDDVKKLFNVFLFLIKQGKAGLAETESLTNCETLEELYGVWKEIAGDKLQDDRNTGRFNNCDHLTKKILGFLDENYSVEISLNLLSEKFDVSPNYISRHFRKETGENLFNYLNTLRVEKAKLLLRNTDLKIYEIGYKVGFNSTVHFNIVFNKLVGLSPGQYKDSL